MELGQQWREQISHPLMEAARGLPTASSIEVWQEAEARFQQLEGVALGLFSSHPGIAGKQPYEGEYRACTAGYLLCGVMRSLQQLRDGEVTKEEARDDVRALAIQLLNLRADHGRFFDRMLNERINQVERIYLRLIR